MLSVHTHSIYEGPTHLGLKPGEYVYAGSVPLEVYGIREARDRDVIVTYDAWCRLAQQYSDTASFSDRKMVIVFPDGTEYDITHNWINWGKGCSKCMIDTANHVNGICTVSLPTVIAYKQDLKREKDLIDIEQIKTMLH